MSSTVKYLRSVREPDFDTEQDTQRYFGGYVQQWRRGGGGFSARVLSDRGTLDIAFKGGGLGGW